MFRHTKIKAQTEKVAGISRLSLYLTRMVMRFFTLVLACAVLCASALFVARATATQSSKDMVTVDITPSHKIASFSPLRTLGSTVDKEPAGSIPALYSKSNVSAMLDAGLGWLSYRLYTELSDQDWHWNAAGTFSAGQAGYWTSSTSKTVAPISDSYGYRLPHRGNTTDQGNNESYSRLDDGNPSTYWKSDPYLTSAFTGDPDEQHPQWVVIDLDQPHAVDEITIAWASPYATRYSVDYWTGDDAIGDPGTGTWTSVAHAGNSNNPRSTLKNALGPVHIIRLNKPVTARFLRILMSQSSNTCDTHGTTDKRNCVGYAIAEISIAQRHASGSFHDYVVHKPCGGTSPTNDTCGVRQTATYVSSVDPWHAARDRVRNQEQPGLDLIARSGLTRGQPAMYPVAMLYSTPENAVAEVRYLRARGYPISYVELGEEPDGQYTSPEDDAALYVQWARALHRFDPTLKLGGPVFSGVNSDLLTWADASGNISWLNRFLNYLKSHHAMNDFAFMSFEHYPSDNGCVHGAELQRDLLREPSIVKGVVNAWRSDGVPASVPLYITEAGFSSVNYNQASMQIEGALWQADYMASSLANGVSGVVYYQYEPVPLAQNKGCPSDWGNLTMFVADAHAHIRAKGAQFYATQMLTTHWVEPGDGQHDLYPASTNIVQGAYPLVTAYAVHRPDGQWSVMLVNKDFRTHDVAVTFTDATLRPNMRSGVILSTTTSSPQTFQGSVTQTSFGPAQYVWRSHGARSAPDPDNPPKVTRLPSTTNATYTIPARSITVIRGVIGT